jgi:hypothetical protein
VTPFGCELVLRENGDEKRTLHTFLAQVRPGTHLCFEGRDWIVLEVEEGEKQVVICRPANETLGAFEFLTRSHPAAARRDARADYWPTRGRRRPLGLGSRHKLSLVRNAVGFLGRVIRAVRIAATDKRIPRPLRWLAALGIAPIPGPFDEVLLLIVAIPLALFYRGPLAEAWSRADVALDSR